MSEDTFILEKRRKTVVIDGRKFIMREMGAEALRSYTKNLYSVGRELKARVAEKRDIEEAMQEASEAELHLLMELLKEPADADKPADEAFLRGLSHSQREAVFKLQDELNDMEGLLKKTASLLS